MDTTRDLQTLPLLFSFAHPIVGDDFVALVRMEGRALLEVEDDGDCQETWISGIAPVGISGGGVDRLAAFENFRRGWATVLFDIAAKAKSFTDFKRESLNFLGAEQESMTDLWQQAVRFVREQAYCDSSLPRGDANHQVSYEVIHVADLGAKANRTETGPRVAA